MNEGYEYSVHLEIVLFIENIYDTNVENKYDWINALESKEHMHIYLFMKLVGIYILLYVLPRGEYKN